MADDAGNKSNGLEKTKSGDGHVIGSVPASGGADATGAGGLATSAEQSEGMDFEEAPVVPVSADEIARVHERQSQMLLNVNRAAEIASMEKEQLQAELASRDREVEHLDDLVNRSAREKSGLIDEINRMTREKQANEKAAADAEAQKLAARAAIKAGFGGADVNEARSWRDARSEDELRNRVAVSSILHPDGVCKECRPKTIGDIFGEDPGLAAWKHKKVNTLREMAAYLDLKEDGKKIQSWNLSSLIKQMCNEKSVSTVSLKTAYREGMCDCAVEIAEKVAAYGVAFDGEEDRISDAISEVLAQGGGRSTRKKMLVLVPDDSVIGCCRGVFREAEIIKYVDEPNLRRQLNLMKAARSWPESLVVVLKKSLGETMFIALKESLLGIAKEVDINIYICADLLPKFPNPLMKECLNMHQEWLTTWLMEKEKPKNVVVMSPSSGLLEKIYPISMLFVLAGRENKRLFEDALRFIVYGEDMQPIVTEKEPVEKMTSGQGSDTPRRKIAKMFVPDKKSLEDTECYKCKKMGHFAKFCPMKK